MNERVKVGAGQVEARSAWLTWAREPGYISAPDWAAVGAAMTNREDAMQTAVVFASGDARPHILVARYIGDPEAVVVSREHPEGVLVDWVGGGEE